MIAKIRLHLNSNAVGYLALFLALGGTSYAAVQLDKGSVRSVHVKNGSLTTGDFSAGALKKLRGQQGPKGDQGAQGSQGLRGADGSQGPKGPLGLAGSQGEIGPTGLAGDAGIGSQGLAGEPGPQGQSGVSGYELIEASSPSDPNAKKETEAPCPEGKEPVGGGVTVNGATAAQVSVVDGPTTVGWAATAGPTENTGDWSITVTAICITTT